MLNLINNLFFVCFRLVPAVSYLPIMFILELKEKICKTVSYSSISIIHELESLMCTKIFIYIIDRTQSLEACWKSRGGRGMIPHKSIPAPYLVRVVSRNGAIKNLGPYHRTILGLGLCSNFQTRKIQYKPSKKT